MREMVRRRVSKAEVSEGIPKVSQDDLGQGSAPGTGRVAVRANVSVTKVSAELGIIWGYASVADIVDLQGDVIPQDELITAVYEFMELYYGGEAGIKVNHDKPAKAVLVESTFHLLGTSLAWYVGVKLLDEDLRQAARDGEISGFSIGGEADAEEEMDEAA